MLQDCDHTHHSFPARRLGELSAERQGSADAFSRERGMGRVIELQHLQSHPHSA